MFTNILPWLGMVVFLLLSAFLFVYCLKLRRDKDGLNEKLDSAIEIRRDSLISKARRIKLRLNFAEVDIQRLRDETLRNASLSQLLEELLIEVGGFEQFAKRLHLAVVTISSGDAKRLMMPSSDPRVLEGLYPKLDELVQNLPCYSKVIKRELSNIPYSGRSSRLDGLHPLVLDLLRESSKQFDVIVENLKALGFGQKA